MDPRLPMRQKQTDYNRQRTMRPLHAAIDVVRRLLSAATIEPRKQKGSRQAGTPRGWNRVLRAVFAVALWVPLAAPAYPKWSAYPMVRHLLGRGSPSEGAWVGLCQGAWVVQRDWGRRWALGGRRAYTVVRLVLVRLRSYYYIVHAVAMDSST